MLELGLALVLIAVVVLIDVMVVVLVLLPVASTTPATATIRTTITTAAMTVVDIAFLFSKYIYVLLVEGATSSSLYILQARFPRMRTRGPAPSAICAYRGP